MQQRVSSLKPSTSGRTRRISAGVHMFEQIHHGCIKCGYDLRATPCSSVCPECGTLAEHTKLGYRVEGEYLIARARAYLPSRLHTAVEATRHDDRLTAHAIDLQIVSLPHCPRLVTAACFTLPVVLSFVVAILIGSHEFFVLGAFIVLLILSAHIADMVRSWLTHTCRLYCSADAVLGLRPKIVRHRDGEYWIKGFGAAYLDHCAAVRAALLADANAVQ